jgi:hypothetical protein
VHNKPRKEGSTSDTQQRSSATIAAVLDPHFASGDTSPRRPSPSLPRYAYPVEVVQQESYQEDVPSMKRHIQFEIYVDFLRKIVESDAWELILKAMSIQLKLFNKSLTKRRLSAFHAASHSVRDLC